MNYAQLGATVKQKYPQYASQPDEVVGKAVATKYPQYQAKIDQKSLGGFVGNLGKSGAQFVGDIGNAVIHPLDTGKNILKLGASVVSLVIPGEQGNEDLARQVGQFYADRYGGLDNAWNTFYNDPVGLAADAATVLGGAGAVVKGVGTAGKMSGVAKAGQAISNVGRAVDPLAAAGKIMSPTKSLFRKVGTGLENYGEKLPTKGLGNPAIQADLQAKYGKTVGQFIDENNLWDRSPEAAAQAKAAIGSKYDALAMDPSKKVAVQKIIDRFDEEISRLENGSGKFSDATQAQIAELQRRRMQFQAAIGEGLDTPPAEIGIDRVTDFRRNAIDPDIPQAMYNLDARGSGTARGAKTTRDILKGVIDSTDPEIAQLGRDYGMARGVEKVFRKAASRANNRQLISLGGVSKAGLGGLLGGVKGAIVGYATDAITNNPAFLKTVSKASKAVGGKIKNAKMPQVPSYASTTAKAGVKIGRMVNQSSSSKQTEKQLLKAGGLMPEPNQSPKTDPTLKSSPYNSLTQPAPAKTKLLKYNSPFSKVSKVKRSSAY